MEWIYGDRICIIGPQGSGKTYVLKALCGQKSHVVVLDTKQDPKEHWEREGVVTEKLSGMRGGRFIWKASDDFIADANTQSKTMEQLLRSGPRVVAIDEGYAIFPTRGARLFGTQCRGKRVSFVFCVQRPATVPLYFITDANFWIIFWLANIEDRKRVEHAVGRKVNWDLLQREEYSFFVFNNKGRHAGPYRLRDPKKKVDPRRPSWYRNCI